MNPPIDGMKYRPYGNEVMIGAWISLLKFMFDDKICRDDFKKETGIDIKNVVLSKGINAFIDEATGYHKKVIIEWADYITLNYWGVEDHDKNNTICMP